MNTSVTFLFGQIITYGPQIAIYIAGLAACVVFWRRMSSAALFAAIGLTLQLFATGVSMMMPVLLFRSGSGAASAGATYTVIMVFNSLIRAAGLGLLVGAVFKDRQREPRGFEVAIPATPISR